MKINKSLLLTGLAILAFPYVTLAETWYVIQGGGYSATWVKQSGDKPGPEYFYMTVNVDPVATGKATVYYSADNWVTASSVDSYGNDCDYSGQEKDNHIDGQQICKIGGEHPWTVTITPNNKHPK